IRFRFSPRGSTHVVSLCSRPCPRGGNQGIREMATFHERSAKAIRMGKDLKQSFSSSYWGIVIASTLGLTVLLVFVADRSQTFAEGSAAVRPRVHLPLVIRPQAEAAVAPQGWLGSVNHYRAMANLPPLTENKSWS